MAIFHLIISNKNKDKFLEGIRTDSLAFSTKIPRLVLFLSLYSWKRFIANLSVILFMLKEHGYIHAFIYEVFFIVKFILFMETGIIILSVSYFILLELKRLVLYVTIICAGTIYPCIPERNMWEISSLS